MKRNHIWSPVLFMLENWKSTSQGNIHMNVIMNSTKARAQNLGIWLIADGLHVRKTQYLLRATQKCAVRGKQGIPDSHAVRKWATAVCLPFLKGVGTDCSRERTERQGQWLKGDSEPTKAFNTKQWLHPSGHNTQAAIFFFFFLIFWPCHMACKILGTHPRIELMPPTSNVLTTRLPGKPLANVFFKGPESKYFCHIFFSFFLQVFNKVKTTLPSTGTTCWTETGLACVWFAEPWPKQIKWLSAGNLAPTGHKIHEKWLKIVLFESELWLDYT